jgi:hypothetical protein
MPLQEYSEPLRRSQHLNQATRRIIVGQHRVDRGLVMLTQGDQPTQRRIRIRGVREQRHDRIRNLRNRRGRAAELCEAQTRELRQSDSLAAQSASRFACSSNGVTCDR